MSRNLINRLITSIILIAILLIVNFTHYLIFIIALTILSIMICIEANNIFAKLLDLSIFKNNKNNLFLKKFNSKFFILNLICFFYVFFIFFQFSYKIHRFESPTFFLFVISICFFSDIGGYTFGKIIGGKKLTKISPNKTISGVLGSFIFSLMPLILFSNLSSFELEFNLDNLIFSFLVSLVSQLGDLFISYLKRNANIKDTGKILPGHGGVLDRVDGIIFALPFSYFLLKVI